MLSSSSSGNNECLDHWMNMISQNVQVIFAVDPTMQGNNGTGRIPRYGCSNHHWSTSELHCGKKAVKVASFPVLPVEINSPCSWEKTKTWLIGEYYLLRWSPDQTLWSLHHFKLLWMLIVESRGLLMAALPWNPKLDYSDVDSTQQSP